MLSVLIPTFNYNVVPLVLELQKQCLECPIPYEILVIDDYSKLFLQENTTINTFENCHFEVLEQNSGRSAVRNLLAKKSKYEWLLFLDADTMPTHHHFIKKYLAEIDQEEKIVYGGIAYQKEKPSTKQLLRWKYGIAREALPVEKRQQNPYIALLTLNFLIHKSIFSTVAFNETMPNLRHEDTLFSYNLMQQHIKAVHIDNPVYHLGLDDFDVALNKEKQAVLGLKYLTDHNLLPADYAKLSRVAARIEKLKLQFAIAFFYKIAEPHFLTNLSSANPSLFVLDLYRLGFWCKLNSN